MLPVYAFTLTGTGTDTTYTGYNGTTDASGQVVFTLPQGSYRFRADYNGTQFWSDPQNSCTVPDCSIAAVTVTIPMTVTVKDTDGTAKAGLPVYAFDGTTYTSYNGTTDTNGQISFTLPQGSYRFRADLDGTQFWSSADNTYTLPGCTVANITVTDPLTVTVKDSAGTAKAGLSVYAFTLTGTGDGTAYTGYTATTDTNGQVSFSLPQGNYRFRADLNGTQFWSSADNTCSLPGCTSADITVTIPLTVTVQDTDGTAKAGLPVYAFTLTGTGTDTTYTGYNGTTDASGQVAFTLPQGSYRFRADLNGTQFWSSADSTCVLPGCTASAITVSKPVTVTVASQTGQPYAGLQVYAFDGTSYTGYNGTTDTKGQVSFTLQQGSYRFQADYNGVQFWSGNENSCTLPGCTAATVTLPGGQSAATNVTINYTYDPLYRLTAADYSDGKYFHYTYDAVGNRLTQDANPSGQPASTSYTYDEANRLTSVGGVSYTWDANGNLLNDGTNSYTYDSANRLTAVSGKQTSVNYVYNGLGDRLQQVVNGNKTTYVNDLNAGLTQVLDDGTNTYLYGNDRIAQSPISNSQSTIQYFLGDALGSVRQMANESGALVYTASYDPYGEVLSASGEAQTSYGYTSEETDSYIKLIDLRSRLYSPEIGRFLTQDSWQGDYNNPLSLNKWLYDYGNPIDAVDPSGYITEQEASAADSDVNELAVLFNIQIKEDWGYQLVPEMPEPDIITEMMIPSLRFGCGWKQGNWRNVHELDLVLQAVKDFSRKLGPGDTGAQVFKNIYNHVLISRWKTDPIMNIISPIINKITKKDNTLTSFAPPGDLAEILGDVVLPDFTFDQYDDYVRFTVVHELGHVWDYRSGNQLSFGLMEALHSWVCGVNEAHSNGHCWDSSKAIEPAPDATINCNPKQPGAGCPGGQTPYSQTYGGAGQNVEGPGWEDWAQSLAYYVYPSYDLKTNGLGPTRSSYVQEQIQHARLP